MSTGTQTNGRFSMDDYIDVAERIAEFSKRYPEGTLQTISWDVEQVGEQTFIVYRAAAYRNPDDPRPGMGIAWEPFPGKTPYTHNSELMNAETSAWGRAIVACGLASKKIASKQEVQARATEHGNGAPSPTAEPPKPSARPASARQRGMLNAKATEAGLSASQLADLIKQVAGQEIKPWPDEDTAIRWLGRAMDRYPASHVTALKDAIEAVKT